MFDPSIGAGTRFKKGSSGNAGGRPRTRVLSEALRNRLAEAKPDDPQHRTWAEAIAANLIEIASSKSPSAVSAANEISDRIEGRPPQHLQISDFEKDLQNRSDQELKFFLANSRWPTDEELVLLKQPVGPTEM